MTNILSKLLPGEPVGRLHENPDINRIYELTHGDGIISGETAELS
ncbi:922_t:CDS:1, partial [Dentiscutata erythropus]